TEPDAVLKILKSSARMPAGKKPDTHYGAGIVDARAALAGSRLRYGGYELALAVLLSLGLFGRLRGRGALGVAPSLGFASAALMGACGLFFLPRAGLVARGFPAWDLAVFGAAGHGSPLFYSAL